MDTKRLTKLSLLTAAALIIFIIELRLPDLTPIPGIKLGLSNIITVYAVYSFSPKEAGLILFARILLGSIFSGNLLALLYSLGGGVLCLVGMCLLKGFIDENHIWLCSVFGGVLHNMGQTAVAFVVMRTSAVAAYIPFLIVSGCIAGAFTGLCAQLVLRKLKKSNKKSHL
jgi:heptaprenyl diphosphate synthase